MVRYTIGLFVIMSFLVGLGYVGSYQSAMAKCQEKHSYDTCFHTLNR